MVARPCRGGIPKVKGRVRMMVMVMVIPGMAPPTMPARVPAQREKSIVGWTKAKRVFKRRSMDGP
jgi:hypothetical protein